jgi:pimeloyl-ACP methyl ester carboxylesterase
MEEVLMDIRLANFTAAYEERGSGLPLLFIHGFPLNRQMWEPQIEVFSTLARVVAPDLRGHGESEALPGPYAMDSLADDCHALLEALGVQAPAVVGGLSMGGYVALAYYRRYPAQVAGLVLAATRAGADTPEGRANRDKLVALAQEGGPQAVVAAMLPKMMAPQTYEQNPPLVDRVREMMEKTSLEGAIGALLGMKDRPDSTPMLTEIKVPALILHGSDDQLIPFPEAEAMHEAIPDSHLRLLPDAGHLLNLEQPALFNQALRSFLDSFV